MSQPPHNVESGHRVFYTIPPIPDSSTYSSKEEPTIFQDTNSCTSSEADSSYDNNLLFKYINENIIGKDKVFTGPFGERKVVYCDYTASGKSLAFIEDFIREEVLPEYGNTHTTTSVTSLQTTLYRHEARDVVRSAVRASDHDAVIFVGSGCTGAIHKLIHNLCLDDSPAPIVIAGPFEHHSNLLPWRHLAYKVVQIRTTSAGEVDMAHLEETLIQESQTGRQLIGTFSVVSNITGILTDTNSVTALLHRHGALSFWDYASGAPYLPIDMNPVVVGPDQALVYKDAIFFSFHKFVGGVQTPGVLVAKKRLFKTGARCPEGAGGGTVFFVRRENQLYLQDAEQKEEGGTPAIVESIRAGLVLQLKQAVGHQAILDREAKILRRAWDYFATCPNLVILGGSQAERLPIFSFLVRFAPNDAPGSTEKSQTATSGGRPVRFLHHNFVCAVLNDLFGIQARGGCACAGPYAMNLLGIDEELATRLEELLVGSGLDQLVLSKYFEYPRREIFRPGAVRINLPYFMSDPEVELVLSALGWVSRHAWRLLPLYKLNPITGEWRHRRYESFRERRWLGFVSYQGGKMTWRAPKRDERTQPLPKDAKECFSIADQLVADLCRRPLALPDESHLFDDMSKEVRWFLLPSEAAEAMWSNTSAGSAPSEDPGSPFIPGTISSCFIAGENLHVSYSKKEEDDVTTQNCEGRSAVCTLCTSMEAGYDDPSNEKPPTVCICSPQTSTIIKSPVTATPMVHAGSAFLSKYHASKVSLFSTSAQSSHQGSPKKGQKQLDVSIPADDTDEPSGRHTKQTAMFPKVSRKKRTSLWFSPPKEIFKPFVRAVDEFKMIQHQDRVIVGLSGGKDSLSLLHTLRQYQNYARAQGVHFELAAATVNPGSDSYDPSQLIPYLEQLGVPYFYEKQSIMDQAHNLPYECRSICSFCSRMKRGRLYSTVRREGYNVLAMGQHLDDLSERDGDIRVIRPFVYVREKHTRQFADASPLPVIPENCPACFEAPKERFRVKTMLAEQEALFPQIYSSLEAAMRPLMARTGWSRSTDEELGTTDKDDADVP